MTNVNQIPPKNLCNNFRPRDAEGAKESLRPVGGSHLRANRPSLLGGQGLRADARGAVRPGEGEHRVPVVPGGEARLHESKRPHFHGDPRIRGLPEDDSDHFCGPGPWFLEGNQLRPHARQSVRSGRVKHQDSLVHGQ